MRSKIVFLSTIFMFAVLASPVNAQLTERDSTLFSTTLDQIEGDVKPGTLSTWTGTASDADTTLNAGGENFTLALAGGSDRWDNNVAGTLNASTGWTWETRIRVDSEATAGRAVFDIVTRENTGQDAGPWVMFFKDGLSYRGTGGDQDAVLTGWEKDLSDDFHTVRMAYDPTDGNHIYLDNVLLQSGWADNNFFSSSRIFIGESSSRIEGGQVTIDYLRFDTTGAFAPVGVITGPSVLALEVNTTTGEVTLSNDSASDIAIDFYEIRSATGDLLTGNSPGDFNGDGDVDGGDFLKWQRTSPANATELVNWESNFGGPAPAGWNSLQDQDFEGNGVPGSGNGWEEGESADATVLLETFLSGNSSIAVDASISLGNAFSLGGTETLTFEYHVAGAAPNDFVTGTVDFATSLQVVSVPEPTSLTLAACLLLMAACRLPLAGRRAS